MSNKKRGSFVKSRQEMVTGASSKSDTETKPRSPMHTRSIADRLAKFQSKGHDESDKPKSNSTSKKRTSMTRKKRTSWVKVPNEGGSKNSSKSQLDEELEALKKRGQVRNNDFTNGCVAENSTVLPEDRQRELQLLQDELSNDPHVKALAAKQRRALERKAARARGLPYPSSSEDEELPGPPSPKRRGSRRRRSSKASRTSTDSTDGKEGKFHADIQEGKFHADLQEEKVHAPIPPAAEHHVEPPSPMDISSDDKCSLPIASRKSLPNLDPDMRMDSSPVPIPLMPTDTLSETLEEEDTTDDEHFARGLQPSASDNDEPEPDRYDPAKAVGDIVKNIVTPPAGPGNYNPDISLDDAIDEEVKTNESVAPAEAPVTNEMELHALTLLRGAIRDLDTKVAGSSAKHPGYAVDSKLLLILRTLEERFSTAAGKRVLQGEATKYHRGNIFDAEKSFIHTFRQSLLLRMAPPTAKRFHDHKNTGLEQGKRRP